MNTMLISAFLMLSAVSSDSPEAIFEKGLQTLKDAHTISGTFTSYTPDGNSEGSFDLAKPNRFSVIFPGLEHRSDGQKAWIYLPKNDTYMPASTEMPFLYPLNAFMESGTIEAESIKISEWRGRKLVDVTLIKPEDAVSTRHIYLDIKTGLPVGGLIQEEERVTEIVFDALKVNEDIPDSVFKWEPPTEAKERIFDQPNDSVSLLKKGTKAPDFSLMTPSGETVSLYETMKGKKAVIVNFWFIACGPCRDELPHLQKMYEDMKDEGLGVIAVNVYDKAEAINKFIADSKYTFPVVMNKPETKKAYEILGCPTSYIIGSDGTILGSFTGFSGDSTLNFIKERLSVAGLPVK